MIELNWKSSDLFIGSTADLDASERLRITYFPGGRWQLWVDRLPEGTKLDEFLGEFPTDDEAKAYARTWVGDDEPEGGDAKP